MYRLDSKALSLIWPRSLSCWHRKRSLQLWAFSTCLSLSVSTFNVSSWVLTTQQQKISLGLSHREGSCSSFCVFEYIHACMTGWRWLSYNTWCSRREKDGLLGLRGLYSATSLLHKLTCLLFDLSKVQERSIAIYCRRTADGMHDEIYWSKLLLNFEGEFKRKALVIFWWPVWVIRVFPNGYWVPSLRSGCWRRIGICFLLRTEQATSKSISLYFEAC